MIDRIASELSRRNLLIGLAASATAATVADATAAPKENPDLIAMADAMPAVLAEYVAARDNVRAIVAEWSPQWPVPDEEIIRYGVGCKDYRGLDGWGIKLPWGKSGLTKMPQLGTPEVFETNVKREEAAAARCASNKTLRKMKFHLHWAEHERTRVEPARAFWSEVDRIMKASGIEEAKARTATAEGALKAAVDQIMTADDWTIAGTVIKAQALGAWAEASYASRAFNDRGAWADLLAASIIRQSGA